VELGSFERSSKKTPLSNTFIVNIMHRKRIGMCYSDGEHNHSVLENKYFALYAKPLPKVQICALLPEHTDTTPLVVQ
jgi:hypothetical protein